MSTLRTRFDSKIKVDPKTGCWTWIGAKNRKGYGTMFVGPKRGSTGLATHVSLTLAGRPRPSEKHHALHRCDTPSCVNPEHLWWGTHADNMADANNKGRLNIDGFKTSWSRGLGTRQKDRCLRGHELSGQNLYVSPQGKRLCSACQKIRDSRRDRSVSAPSAKAKQLDLEDSLSGAGGAL